MKRTFFLFCRFTPRDYWGSFEKDPRFVRIKMQREDPVFLLRCPNTNLVILDETKEMHPGHDVLLARFESELQDSAKPLFFSQHAGQLENDYLGALDAGVLDHANGDSIGTLALAIRKLLENSITCEEVIASLNVKLKGIKE